MNLISSKWKSNNLQWILFLILLLFLVFSFTCPINESFSIFDKIKSFGDKARDDLEGSFKTIKKESENTFDLIKNNVNNISDQIKSGDIDPILKLRSLNNKTMNMNLSDPIENARKKLDELNNQSKLLGIMVDKFNNLYIQKYDEYSKLPNQDNGVIQKQMDAADIVSKKAKEFKKQVDDQIVQVKMIYDTIKNPPPSSTSASITTVFNFSPALYQFSPSFYS